MGSPQVAQDETARLKRAVEELSILNDLARAIGASFNSHEIMQTIVRRSLRALNAEQGVITLIDRNALDPMKTLVRAAVSSTEREQFHLPQTLLGWMQLNMKPLLVDDLQHDDRFRGVKADSVIVSVLCVPLMVKSELKGVLTIYNKREGHTFTPDDQRLLAIIAAQSAQVIENARLYEEEQQYMKMQQEVRLAATIQLELLPKSAPTLAGYDIHGLTIPAQTVGGDYYDFIPINERRTAICIGDVTGKGLPASLLMANLQATLRGQTLIGENPKVCLVRSNKLLFQSTSQEKFATVFYGILDVKEHVLSYANAGHDHPVVMGDHAVVRRLNKGGIMLGAFEEFPYEDEVVPLPPGTTLVMYSDGITEAMNSAGDMYGEERLLQFLQANRAQTAKEIADALVADVRSFVGSTPQSDDMTVVVVARKA